MKKYTAKQIAEWFLFYNRTQMEEFDADLISNLKLQKLLYYAQGCCLALTNDPLFNDPIVAWDHGPVVEDVYYEYKVNGSNGIEYTNEFSIDIDKDVNELLIDVFSIFGKYSAWGLRNMTHEETPWKETARSEVITSEIIQKYFKENYTS